MRGTLTSARTESLNATADSLNPNLRNKNTTQNTALSAASEIGGPWRITAGVSNSNYTNEQAVIGQSDTRSTGVNGGVRYVLGSELPAYFLQRASGTGVNDFTSTTR